ncbi:ShlB/FhaC/HecB family hemolysin secretion/activation protein [Ramlibacter paludis]|uniref:ShlB/FhaC/HecB family hemolysin secretion/activation protein n=1 Tax=Ramlibacter paludis TaxID=2908000 RepID=UPI0023DC7339|nr:ShlB/FhaC/HecB family hemolysin secretion/activation protein [Ramlibacter paludis]
MCTLLAAGPQATAQRLPSAGALTVPTPPPAPAPAPGIRIEPRNGPAAPVAPADQTRIPVKVLHVSGATLFPEAELLALTGFTPGSALSLADLQAMAARVTAHYRNRGYFVAQAYLPAQDIQDQEVTIAVSEGRLGKVDVRNQTNVSDRVVRTQLDGLEAGDVIANRPFESGLLLLSDVPGVNVISTLVPGTTPGTSDLVVELTPSRRLSGSIDADNGGNRYTGEYRLGATLDISEPLGLGDVASLRVLTSGSGLNYARASYQLQVGHGQAGIAYSHLRYQLGREFASLEAHGTADIASVYGRYPVLRTRDNNLYLQLELDAKSFRDEVDTIPARIDRKSHVLLASVYGDHRDDFFGGGMDSYSATLASGVLDIQTPAARAVDDVTAHSNGHFNKLSFQAMRLQRLGGGPFSVYAAASGQLASKNLDVSEKMQLGGMNGVRAYPEGEAYGDEGYLLTLEGRMDITALPPAIPGAIQLVAFVDAGGITINKNPWAPIDNHRRLSAAGVGINWAQAGNFLVRTSYARKLGDAPALSAPDKSGRFWVQLVKYF